MSKETKLRFAATIEQLGVIYRTEISDLLLRAYWQALKDVSITDLEREAALHIASSKFFPKPCELRGEDAEADSVRAWDSAIAAIHQHGMYRHVDFEDAVVNAVIRYLGGWPEFCCFDPSDEQWRPGFSPVSVKATSLNETTAQSSRKVLSFVKFMHRNQSDTRKF